MEAYRQAAASTSLLLCSMCFVFRKKGHIFFSGHAGECTRAMFVLLLTTGIIPFFIVDAAKNGGQHAAKNGSGGSKAAAADAVTRKTGMSVDEAMNILNITKEADLAKIVKVTDLSIITGHISSY